jgi:hypothetical protein
MAVRVSIDPGVLDRLLNRRGGRVERNLRERLDRVEDQARDTAPGNSARYVSSHIERAPRGLRGVVTYSHPKAIYIVHPTPEHEIRARRARALRFVPRGASAPVFRQRVWHPGAKGNDFLVKALRAAR